MDINYINSLLKNGESVKKIRETLGISEKKFQKEIKELGYKFNQKEKAYIKTKGLIIEDLCKTTECTTETTTETTTEETTALTTNYATSETTLTATQTTTIDYLADNIDLIKQLLENYKRNTQSNNTDIIINLISDKHLNPKPKSIRINEFVWRDWQEFIKDLTFNKGDLISQALKEFMENHD